METDNISYEEFIKQFNEYRFRDFYIVDYEKVKAHPKVQDWGYICLFKILSKEFIIEFAEYINFEAIMYNNQISQDIKDYCRMFI